MRIDIPFIKQQNKQDCGPATLLMVCEYFGIKTSFDEINQLAGTAGRGMFTLELALAASGVGLDTYIYSSQIAIGDEKFEDSYYRENFPEGMDHALIAKVSKAGVSCAEKSLSLDEVLKLLSDDAMVIVLADWNRITRKQGYRGHYVVLTGYNDDAVFVHNPGYSKGAFEKIPKKLLEKARMSPGTDQDVIVLKKIQ